MYVPPPPSRDPFMDFGRCVVAAILGVTAACFATAVVIREPGAAVFGMPYALMFAGPGGVVIAGLVLFAVRRIDRPRRAVILGARAFSARLRRALRRHGPARVASPAAALADVDLDADVGPPAHTAIGASIGALLAFANVPAWVVLAVVETPEKAAVVFLAAGAICGAWMGRAVAAGAR